VIKVAAALDAELFTRVERDLELLLQGDGSALAPVVAAAAWAKARLVESDPEEHGRRKLLNLGHTLGHAIEAELGYGRMAHGDAVAHGCRFALQLAAGQGGDREFRARFEALLERAAIPPLGRLSAQALLERMGRDKKARASGLSWILPLRAGRAEVVSDLPRAIVEEELAKFLNTAGGHPL
jgi:3-dehydroquinate synthase